MRNWQLDAGSRWGFMDGRGTGCANFTLRIPQLPDRAQQKGSPLWTSAFLLLTGLYPTQYVFFPDKGFSPKMSPRGRDSRSGVDA